MANRKLKEKVQGAVETCSMCNTSLVCNLKAGSGDYPAKLQWQNADGKAHFNYDFKTSKNTCNAICASCGNRMTVDSDNGSNLYNADQWQEHIKTHAGAVSTMPPENTIDKSLLKDIPDIEKPPVAKTNGDPTGSIITSQIELLDKIELRIKDFFKITEGNNYSVEKLGLWTKLIYQHISN